MAPNDSDSAHHSIDRFWHNYLFLLEKHGVTKKARPWYRRHIEDYIAAYPDVKLRQHTPQFVDDYLNAKGRHDRFQNGSFDK